MEDIDMKNYKKNYPYYEVKKINSVKELLEKAASEAGGRLAFIYKRDETILNATYAKFQEDTLALGTALANINMVNNHIAVIGENSYDWVTVYLTVLKTNGVFVPVDKELPEKDIINVLDNSDSEVLFYSKKFQKYIDEFKAKLPRVKYFIGFDVEESEDNVLSYTQFIEDGRVSFKNGNKIYENIETNPMDLRMLVYTSGTTGMAKGVMLSEHNLISCVYYGLQVSTVYDRCLSVLPYHHTYEAVAGILVSLHHHSTICINDSLKAVLKNLKMFKPDYVYLVPAFVEIFYKKIWSNAKETHKEIPLKILINLSNFLRIFNIDLRNKFFSSIHDAFGGNLIKIVVGGAPLKPEYGKFFDSIGINLINGYGITECSPLVSANRDNFNDCSTVGPVLPCCKVKFENITPEGYGEICVKGDIVMMGYYKNPELTNEVLKDGWFNTGDFGRLNKKQQLLITGRKKNLIVLENGKNVFPEEIENYVMNVPYIKEVVVRGIKGSNGSETGLLAEVFLNEDLVKELKIENVEATLKKDIAKQCAQLPIYKKISQITIRDTEFVKTTTNKIKR